MPIAIEVQCTNSERVEGRGFLRAPSLSPPPSPCSVLALILSPHSSSSDLEHRITDLESELGKPSNHNPCRRPLLERDKPELERERGRNLQTSVEDDRRR